MSNPSFPTTVDLAITGRCNLRCKHCNTSGTWNLADELSFQEITSILDQLKEEKIFNLNIFGGEPFCHPQILDFIRLVDKYPFRVTFLTNGTLIDDDMIKELKAMRFLEAVQVSIDGSCPEVHDWQRGVGSFEMSMRAIAAMKKAGLAVKIKAIINSRNCGDIENMIKMAMDMGLRGMDFGDAVACGNASEFRKEMLLDGAAHRDIMETLFALKVRYPGFFIGGTLGQKLEMLAEFYEKGPGKGTRGTFSTCSAGHNALSIRSDGKVVPCSELWTYICGDVRKEKLTYIWERSRELKLMRGICDEPLEKYGSKCKECDYMTYCNGGCRASAFYSSGGDIKGIDPSNCLVFSGLCGFRVDRDKVLKTGERSNSGCSR